MHLHDRAFAIVASLAIALLTTTGCAASTVPPSASASASAETSPQPSPLATGPGGLAIFTGYEIPDGKPFTGLPLPTGDVLQYGNGYEGGAGTTWKFVIQTDPVVTLDDVVSSFVQQGFEASLVERQSATDVVHLFTKDGLFVTATDSLFEGNIEFTLAYS